MSRYMYAILSVTTVLAIFTGAQEFYNHGGDIRCARIWETINFQGKSLDCNQNERLNHMGQFDCKAESVIVRDGCTLTMKDKNGCQKSVEGRTDCLYDWSKRVSSACCQCGGCSSEAVRTGLSCARLFQHEKCSFCSGFRLDVNHLDAVTDLQILNNQISSVLVADQCQLTVWDGQNFTGHYVTIRGFQGVELLNKQWNDRISSLKCTC